MTTDEYRKLYKNIQKAVIALREVDVSVAPSDEQMEVYEALRKYSDELKAVTSYIIDGD